MGPLPDAGSRPLDVRLRDASRRRHHGRTRPDRGPRGAPIATRSAAPPRGRRLTPRYDVVVVGAGHNGLVAGAYLARSGRRVLIVERRDRVGGILANTEVAPGVTAPGIAHTVGRLRESVIRDLRLGAHGFSPLAPDVRAFAPQADGPPLIFWADAGRTAEGLRSASAHDADAYPS